MRERNMVDEAILSRYIGGTIRAKVIGTKTFRFQAVIRILKVRRRTLTLGTDNIEVLCCGPVTTEDFRGSSLLPPIKFFGFFPSITGPTHLYAYGEGERDKYEIIISPPGDDMDGVIVLTA